ncbi:hypothetical protein QN397_26130, partial [Variovorax sp. RTB1]|nr:hypothetical protein [Variovorax sp. RTB1]
VWAWSNHSQEQTALVATQAKALESQRAAVEAERTRVVSDAQTQARLATDKATGAMKEVELEKRRLAEQQAEVAAKAEALRQRELAQAAKTAEATLAANSAGAGAASVAAPPPAIAALGTATAASGVWDARMKEASPHLRKMMEAALANTGDLALTESAAIRAMPRPARGDRKMARPQNEDGLAASARPDLPRAVASFTAASIADESDEEIATNLGYALVKAGRGQEAQDALLRALYLNPSRSSAWYNLGLAFLTQNQEQAAYASFLLTYQFAGSQQKSREWFEKVALDESNPSLRRMSQKLLTSPIVKASLQTP